MAALHEFGTENGSYAEYAVALDFVTFHIPHNVSFEEAATIPSTAHTAAQALYIDLKLPLPYDREPGGEKMPFVIYGVTSAVGAFAAKFARLSGVYPIIGIAGQSSNFAKSLVDYVVDYRKGEEALASDIAEVLVKEGLPSKAPLVLDAISEGGTIEATLRFLDPVGGVVAHVLPLALFAKDGKSFKYPPGITDYNPAAPRIFSTLQDFGYLWTRYIGRLLREGRLTGHPHEVIPGGLNGVLKGLQSLKEGKARGVKYVFRIEETEDDTSAYPGVEVRPPGGPAKRPVGENTHPLRNFPFPLED